MQKEIKMLNEEVAKLSLESKKDKNLLNQERIDNKKTVSIMEKTIMNLNKEKEILQGKLNGGIFKSERRKTNLMDQDTQTVIAIETSGEKSNMDKFSSLQEYSNTLKEEINQISEKLKKSKLDIEESHCCMPASVQASLNVFKGMWAEITLHKL